MSIDDKFGGNLYNSVVDAPIYISNNSRKPKSKNNYTKDKYMNDKYSLDENTKVKRFKSDLSSPATLNFFLSNIDTNMGKIRDYNTNTTYGALKELKENRYFSSLGPAADRLLFSYKNSDKEKKKKEEMPKYMTINTNTKEQNVGNAGKLYLPTQNLTIKKNPVGYDKSKLIKLPEMKKISELYKNYRTAA